MRKVRTDPLAKANDEIVQWARKDSPEVKENPDAFKKFHIFKHTNGNVPLDMQSVKSSLAADSCATSIINFRERA